MDALQNVNFSLENVEVEHLDLLEFKSTHLDVLARVGQLPDDSFIYCLTYSLDSDGVTVITRDFSKSLGERANRPVLSWLDLHAFDIAIMGGRVTTTKASATMSVDIMMRVFDGEPIDSIQPEPPYIDYIYHWDELEKWGVDLKKIPPGSVIQNQPHDFFELFKWQIIGGVSLLITQSLLVFFCFLALGKDTLLKRNSTATRLDWRRKSKNGQQN